MTVLPRFPRKRRRGRASWARRQGELLLSVAELLEAAPAAAAGKPGLQDGVTVLELARSLAAAAASDRRERRSALDADWSEAAARIRAGAVDRLTVRPYVGPRELGATLADAWELAAALGRPLTVDPAASKAAAEERLRRAPLAIRMGVRGRRLIASDAGWEVGAGEPLAGSAAAIVLYLHGRGGLPSRGGARPAGKD